MHILSHSNTLPDSLTASLADRDVSIWLRAEAINSTPLNTLVDLIRLPWKHVFLEQAASQLIAALEIPDSGALVRRRGFIHIIETDPSRIELPSRALPVFLLSGRGNQAASFESQLRRITMMEELRRSCLRQLVIVGDAEDIVPNDLALIWKAGFRTRLVISTTQNDAYQRLEEWFKTNGKGPTATLTDLHLTGLSSLLINSFTRAYSEECLLARLRGEAGGINQIDLTDIDDPERPLLDSYSLIQERDFASADAFALPEEAFNAFFRSEFDDWRAFASGLPWIRDEEAWSKLQAQLRRLDASGSAENRITYIVSEAGAGGTTLARHLAFTAARAGYPTLVAKGIPFTPDALPLINFLTRVAQRNGDSKPGEEPIKDTESESRLYETPWLLVFDRMHWEFRETELRRFLQQLQQAGRPVCVLVVTGPQRDLTSFDESRFKPLAELHHMLESEEALELGRHLNRFLRTYNKERPDWQWRAFQESHAVRHMESLSSFWITLAFWLQGQYDLNESFQDRVYSTFQAHADTPEIRRAVLQIAALSSERLPMPESLIEQGGSDWPVPLLLDDRRNDLSPLGLMRLSHGGRKYWAMSHDILGRLLINALFYDHEARCALGFSSARDAQHLRFAILREVSAKFALGEADQRDFGEEFATTVFKIDPDHGRSSWIHIWREVLAALDGMPAALRNSSRVFRHHTAISRRRIAWLDEIAYEVNSADKTALLERAIEDINYALNSIAAKPGGEPDVNLYNSLANAYFDLARVRASQSAPTEELAKLRKLASEATRHAYEQNPSSPYVIETHVKSLIAIAAEVKENATACCIEALEIVYASIKDDRNERRRHALTSLADQALAVLISSGLEGRSGSEPNTPADVLVGAWITLREPLGRAPDSLDELPTEVLEKVLQQLDHPAGVGNSQVVRLRYQILAAVVPYDFEQQLQSLELLVATDYRMSPQLRLEYALLLFQQMRADEANQQFKALRVLWRETDISVQVPLPLRWLLSPNSNQPRVVTATFAHDHGHRAMARVTEFGRIEVPYRAQEFSVREHRPGAKFSALVSFGHNGPFLRPVNATR